MFYQPHKLDYVLFNWTYAWDTPILRVSHQMDSTEKNPKIATICIIQCHWTFLMICKMMKQITTTNFHCYIFRISTNNSFDYSYFPPSRLIAVVIKSTRLNSWLTKQKRFVLSPSMNKFDSILWMFWWAWPQILVSLFSWVLIC